MKWMLSALFVVIVALAGLALAQPNEKANGFYGCTSGGATEANPGQWFKALKVNDVAGGVLLGLNPAELADLENTTPGWKGAGITPNVGALIANFCGEDSIAVP